MDAAVFDDTAPDDATVRAVLERADRAPSLHNSQPWRWHWNGVRLALHVDPDRLLPSTDAFNRQGIIGCGIALHHAATACAAAGWQPRIRRFPKPTDRTCLATLEFDGRGDVLDTDSELAAAIDHRYTDRAPYTPAPHWPDLVPVLDELCRRHDTRLLTIDAASRATLAEISWTAATTRRHDPHYRTELMWWLGGAGPDAGVPASAIPAREDIERVPTNRVFLPGTADPGPEQQDHAHIVALTSPDDTIESLLACGEALSAVLLECTVHELATCVMSHLTELPATRARVATAIGDPHPQIFLRIGSATAPMPPRTPRRPVEDVLEAG
ncbi:Acg family FMN-binding oxidoreductase [Nocardia bovistercoris]|uniref:NAD(P)H nitroreductase n=1 Tax=Nocardia bovistercoris TaxID=2785916 RepID=A0A931N8F7_9NOCA|nr:hypothetical protein [Nocardia bovistercoris]MBH0781733.1 hypothetical protein [Nocardia bovistercoris]